jgi:hypothetical protein
MSRQYLGLSDGETNPSEKLINLDTVKSVSCDSSECMIRYIDGTTDTYKKGVREYVELTMFVHSGKPNRGGDNKKMKSSYF